MRTASKDPQKKRNERGNLQARIPTLRGYGFLLALRKQTELREETGSRAQSHWWKDFKCLSEFALNPKSPLQYWRDSIFLALIHLLLHSSV